METGGELLWRLGKTIMENVGDYCGDWGGSGGETIVEIEGKLLWRLGETIVETVGK